MFKNCKKVVSLFMAVAMMFLLFTPVAASAETTEHKGADLSTSNALFRSRGKDVSLQLSKDLKAMDIEVRDDTLIECISSRNDNVADVMVVTNTKGSAIEKAFITSVDSDGEQRTYGEWNDGDAWSDTPLGDSFNLVMMVEYNRFETNILQEYYYQPVNMIFIYYDSARKYTATSIEVDYQCGGYEYIINRDPDTKEITGYTAVTSGAQQYTHNIVIKKAPANRNTYYGGNNPYNPNRAIDVNRGAWATHLLSYDVNLVRNEDGKKIQLDGIMGIDQL